MCGRYHITTNPDEIARRFKVSGPLPNFPPNWNAGPGQNLPVVRFNPKTKVRQLDPIRWGFVPIWAKDLASGYKCINARAESIATSGMFKDAFLNRRCLIPADGFYDWRTIGAAKQPYAIAMEDRGPFALAGLWDRWKDPASGEWIRTFAIVTTAANELCAPLHERMPAILDPDRYAAWLGDEDADPARLAALLAPYDAARMAIWPVSQAVGNVKNNGPELVEAIGVG